jgi:hypothetical protein
VLLVVHQTHHQECAARAGRRINSSLVLQQLLYYNCFWSAVWILTVGVRVYFKVGVPASSSQK